MCNECDWPLDGSSIDKQIEIINEETLIKCLKIRFYEDVTFLLKCNITYEKAIEEAFLLNKLIEDALRKKIVPYDKNK